MRYLQGIPRQPHPISITYCWPLESIGITSATRHPETAKRQKKNEKAVDWNAQSVIIVSIGLEWQSDLSGRASENKPELEGLI
jgi:hypothetical protein